MKRRLKITLITMVVLLFAAPMCVQAAAGSKATGAKLPNYTKVVTITVGGADSSGFDRDMKNALIEAKQNASNKTQYKIVIEPGTYTQNWAHKLPSNVYIYAVGATVNSTGKIVLGNERETSQKNIIIEGGVWSTVKQDKKNNANRGAALFRFAHIDNLIIKNATLKCKREKHIIELGDTDGLTIKGCNISGNTVQTQVGPLEAIQLDVATEAAMVGMKPYNGNGCHNAIIEDNIILNGQRGIGSHSLKEGSEKTPYTNITVRRNTIKNMKAEGIFLLHWKNCTIEKNAISNVKRAGIFMEDCSKNKVRLNSIRKVGTFGGKYASDRKNLYGKLYSGVLLRNSTSNEIKGNTLAGSKKAKVVLEQFGCKKNTIKSNKTK